MKKRFEIIAKYFLNVLTCLVIVSIFFALYGFFQISILDKSYASYFGYSLFEVESGSMSPTINVKDMVIVKKTSEISKDDIVTYELDGNFITHRVVEVGEKKVVAKGDYNNYEDKTIPRKSIIGKVVLRIPKFGIWKEIILSPIVLIVIFFTMLLFGLGFSYEDRKLAAKKRVGYTFKDEVFEEESNGKEFNKFKKYLKKITALFSKSNVKDEKINVVENVSSANDDNFLEEVLEKSLDDSSIVKQIDIIGTCKWIDDDNRDGIRPKSIVIKLISDGKVLRSVEVTDNNWSFAFKGLYKYDEFNKEIKYSVDSNMVSGYKKDIVGYDVIHTHNPKKMNISGMVLWDDNNNVNSTRPNSISVKLIKNNEIIFNKKVSKSNKWKYTFIDLYKYENGEEIKYIIDEDNIKKYEKSISGYNINNTYISKNK